MKTPLFRSLLLSACLLPALGHLRAGEIWAETTYFVPEYQLTEKIPVPAGDWKLYQRTKILIGDNVEGIEYLDGFQKGTISWLVNDKVVTVLKDGQTVIEPKVQGEVTNWATPVEAASWTKGQKPFASNKEGARRVLIFDEGGEEGKPARRIWIDSETRQAIAQYKGKFITLYEQKEAGASVTPPPNVQDSLKRQQASQRKLGTAGAMPQ